MTTGLIICGALGKEVVDIVDKHGWDAEVIAEYLELPLTIIETGYGFSEEQLVTLMKSQI